MRFSFIEVDPTASHLGLHPFSMILLLFLLTTFVILLEFLLNLCLKISHIYFLCRFLSFASLEGFGIEIFVNGVDLFMIFFYFELLICKRVDSFAHYSHLILIEAEILNAEGISHDQIHLGDKFIQTQIGILADIQVQLL